MHISNIGASSEEQDFQVFFNQIKTIVPELQQLPNQQAENIARTRWQGLDPIAKSQYRTQGVSAVTKTDDVIMVNEHLPKAPPKPRAKGKKNQ